MAGHLLGDFELSAILQIRGNAGSAEAVAANFCSDASVSGAPLNHHVYVVHAKSGSEDVDLHLWKQSRKFDG